jgi:hypothetical protein
MNAKTWFTICGFAPLLMIGASSFLILRQVPQLVYLCIACSMALAIVCTIGAWFGILICLGRLHFGCPFCNTRSPFTGGGGRNLYLKCPNCGTVCVTIRNFRPATAEKIDESDM